MANQRFFFLICAPARERGARHIQVRNSKDEVVSSSLALSTWIFGDEILSLSRYTYIVTTQVKGTEFLSSQYLISAYPEIYKLKTVIVLIVHILFLL